MTIFAPATSLSITRLHDWRAVAPCSGYTYPVRVDLTGPGGGSAELAPERGMHSMRKRRSVAWLVALAVGLTLVPATQAMAASKHEKKQDARIAKVNKRVTAVVKKATKTANKVAGLTTALQDQTQALVNLT